MIQENSNKINAYTQHYNLFCYNINSSLKKELCIEYNDKEEYLKSDWKPPSTYGLNNSERIIPQHYFEPNNKSFKEIDMFYELTKDIRNLQPLTDIKLNYIKSLPKEKIIELLELYNLCLKNINELLLRL